MQKSAPYYASVTCTVLIVLVAILSYLGVSPFHVSNRLPSYDLLMSYFKLGLPLFIAGCIFSFQSKHGRGALLLGNLLFIGLPLCLLVLEYIASLWQGPVSPAFEEPRPAQQQTETITPRHPAILGLDERHRGFISFIKKSDCGRFEPNHHLHRVSFGYEKRKSATRRISAAMGMCHLPPGNM